jgi:hypothetical protein
VTLRGTGRHRFLPLDEQEVREAGMLTPMSMLPPWAQLSLEAGESRGGGSGLKVVVRPRSRSQEEWPRCPVQGLAFV